MRARPIFDWLHSYRREPRPRLFPRLGTIDDKLPTLRDAYDPAGRSPDEQVAMLEAKVEYLLDELYRLKSHMRSLLAQGSAIAGIRVSDVCRDTTLAFNSLISVTFGFGT